MQPLSFAGELPVFVAGDHRHIVGRAEGFQDDHGVTLTIRLRKHAGLVLINMLRDHVPLGVEIHFNPTREVKNVKKEDQDGAVGAVGAQQPSVGVDEADAEAVRSSSSSEAGQVHEER